MQVACIDQSKSDNELKFESAQSLYGEQLIDKNLI